MGRLAWLDLQDWVEDIADSVLEKRARTGPESLSGLEHVIHNFWFANYCMMNAGDLANAIDDNPKFLEDTAALALGLGMSQTHAAFALPRDVFEKRYCDLLPPIADEMRHRLQSSE